MQSEIISGRGGIKYSITAVLFFLVFLGVSLSIYDDYGLSFDEDVQRAKNGYVNYNYIQTGNDTILLQSVEKYHGPAFEIFLVFTERILNLTDERSTYLSRHLLTFLLFFAGVVFFYLLSRNYLNSNGAALLSCAMLILSPRIFADSFYNSKDIAFLSVFIISIYFLTRFLQRQDFFFASIHALFTGILIDIRITGIIIPLLTVLIFLANRILRMYGRNVKVKSVYLFLYLTLSVVFVIFFWPVLWIDPLHHFIEAFREMSKFPWFGYVTFMGTIYLADALPWYYLPVWIFISTPFIYSILFCAGVFFTAVHFFKSPLLFYKNEKESAIFLVWFFVPLLSVILLGAVVYDGWRHLYFIYPAFILLSVRGFYSCIDFFERRNYTIWKRVLKVVVAGSVIYVAVIMIISHPWQNVYFNFFVRNPERFERDYWGLSFRKGLEYILETDSSDKIVFTGSNSDVALNTRILPWADKARLMHTDYFEFADYYLDNFRWKRWVNQPVEEIFSLAPMNAKIMSVFKVHHHQPSEKTVLTMKNDFEKTYPGWSQYRDTVVGVAAYSGISVCKIDSGDIYSVGISIPYDSLTIAGQALVVFASLQTYAFDITNVPLLVISISNREEKNSYWTGMKLLSSEEPGKWKETVFEVEIPANINAPHRFKAYIWNPHKGEMYVDDFTLKIVKAN